MENIVANQDLENKLQQLAEGLARLLDARIAIVIFDLPLRQPVHYVEYGKSGANLIPPPDLADHLLDEQLAGFSLHPSDGRALERSDPARKIPLALSGSLAGMLVITPATEAQAHNDTHELIINLAADYIVQAIEAAQMQSAIHKQRKQAESLLELTRLFHHRLEQQPMLELILDQLANVVDYDSASVMLTHRDQLAIVAQRRFRTQAQLFVTRQIQALLHIKEVVENRKAVIIPDTLEDSRWHKLPHSNYIRCWLGVPLEGRDQVIGLINLDKSEPHYYTAEDINLATAFANQAAIAIENAGLIQSARLAAERREILHQVSQEIVTASLDPEGIYTAIHRAAQRLMPAEAFVITHYDEASEQLVAGYLIDRSGRVPPLVIPIGRGVSGRVFASRKALYIPDTQQPELLGDALHFGDPDEVRSLIAVPMFLHAQVVGTLSAQSYQPDAYSPEDLALLEMLATYAAIALENARLFLHIQHLAITDPLTHLFNRRHLFELGKREFQRASRFQRNLSVIMVDMDHFHSVNEIHGHKTGDYVLGKVGQLLSAHIREIDVAGRYGGEEFTILLPETGLLGAIDTAERLRAFIASSFESETFPSISGDQALITASFGVARLTPASESFIDLLDRADQALYRAKGEGRNRVMVDDLP